MGCFTGFLKATNLIYYINRAEIVKNFTNFACDVYKRTIKFRRSSNRLGSRCEVCAAFGEVHRFLR